MKKTLVILALSSACYLNCADFSQGANPTIPKGPLIALSAPDFSRWTAVCVYPVAESQEVSEAKYQENLRKLREENPEVAKYLESKPSKTITPRQVQQISVVKTGDIKHEIFLYPSENKQEIWTTPDAAVQWDSFLNRYTLLPSGSALKAEDFPEFNWVSEKNFVNTKTIKGKECLVFADKVDKQMVDDPRSFKREGGSNTPETVASVVAVIDLETRLPVSLQCGGQLRNYVFYAAPTSKLSMPPEFEAAVRNVQEQLNATKHRRSPPR